MNLKCEKCNKGFATGFLSKGGSATFIGGINAQCPACGHVNIIPGSKMEFDKNGNIIKAYLLDSKIPKEDLLKFIEIANEYIEKKYTDEAAFTREISSVNPKLQKLLSLIDVKTPGDFFSLISLVVSLITLFLSNDQPPVVNNITHNQYTINQVENKTEHTKPKNTNKQPKKKRERKVE